VTIFYCLRLETSPTRRARSPYLYPSGTWWPSYTPRHWVPFSSPPTTRRTTVGVFEPASIRGSLNRSRSVESYSLGAGPQRTPPASPLVLLRYIATAVRVTYHDIFSIVACGHYLATALFSASTVLALSKYSTIFSRIYRGALTYFIE
jgi:hypothetical protein